MNVMRTHCSRFNRQYTTPKPFVCIIELVILTGQGIAIYQTAFVSLLCCLLLWIFISYWTNSNFSTANSVQQGCSVGWMIIISDGINNNNIQFALMRKYLPRRMTSQVSTRLSAINKHRPCDHVTGLAAENHCYSGRIFCLLGFCIHVHIRGFLLHLCGF